MKHFEFVLYARDRNASLQSITVTVQFSSYKEAQDYIDREWPEYYYIQTESHELEHSSLRRP